MHSIVLDLRYSVRQLWKSPGFTIPAVATLAIGIGANTALFSSMDAVVLHPLAVPALDQVVTVQEQHGGDEAVALANYVDWARESRAFEQLAVRFNASVSMTGEGDATRVQAALTSAGFFPILRVQPLLGRVYTEAECAPGFDAVAVLSYTFWQTRFAGDPSVLGRQIRLDQRVYTVIGVTPKSVQYPSRTDVFAPFAPPLEQLANRSAHDYHVLGRLRPGVSVTQAQAELRNIADRLAKTFPATNLGWSVKVTPLLDNINGPYTPMYYRLVMGVTLLVLLVICANVANLQFARALPRRREIALRTALGASGWRLTRQLLIENIVLALAGGVGGLIVGAGYLHLLLIGMPERVARSMAGWSQISLNGRTLLFSLLLAVGAGVVVALMPALEAFRVAPVEHLKSSTRSATGRGHRVLAVFAALQIALAVALVIGAALISKGMGAMLHVADVYRPETMLTFEVSLPVSQYDTPQKTAAWFRDSLDRLRSLPGVHAAEATTALPYSDYAWTQEFEIENRPKAPGTSQNTLRLTVSEGYFAALRTPIIAGRGFSATDSLESPPVAVVSRRFAEHYFPGENPIGHRIRMGAEGETWLTIIGVGEEATYSMWKEALRGEVYISAAQIPPHRVFYAVVGAGDPLSLAAPARKALAGIDPLLPLDAIQTYSQLLHENLTGLIYAALLMGVDALIAFLLAAIGVFSLMANLVGERTREIGVRLAVGARREDVLRMILGQASILTAIGVGVGLPLAFGLARLSANLLRGVKPTDPVVFGGVTAAIVLATLIASWAPARRASHVDPMTALRDE